MQDVSRPIFRRSALENIEESDVLLFASCQPYVEWAYLDWKHTPACYFRERKKGGRRKGEIIEKIEMLIFIKETQHYLKQLFKLLDPTKLYSGQQYPMLFTINLWRGASEGNRSTIDKIKGLFLYPGVLILNYELNLSLHIFEKLVLARKQVRKLSEATTI